MRFLASCRRPELIAQEFVPLVLETVAGSPGAVVDVERRLVDVVPREVVRPVVLHLLWQSRLVADLRGR